MKLRMWTHYTIAAQLSFALRGGSQSNSHGGRQGVAGGTPAGDGTA